MYMEVVLLLISVWVSVESTVKDHYGREFYFGMPLNDHQHNLLKCNTTAVDIASRQSGHLQITAYVSPYHRIDVNETLNSGTTTVNIPCLITRLGNFTEKRGVYIKTDVDVSVYATTHYRSTTDTFLVLPLQSLGKKYIVSSYAPAADTEYSYFSVIGAYDNTQVMVRDSQNAAFNANVTLNRLDMFQQISINDLTNLIVESDKPVVVYAGTTCANVPHDIAYCDLIAEQMIPVEYWAKEYIVPPILPQTGYEIRILKRNVQDNAPVCMFNETKQVCVNVSSAFNSTRGYIFENRTTVVSSKDAVSVVQYGVGDNYDANDEGDPFMTIIPGLDNYLSFYSFAVPHVYTYGFDNFIAVIVSADDKQSLILDGNTFTWNTTYDVPEPYNQYEVIISSISPGYHELKSGNQSPFGLVVYGYNSLSGYGYSAGMLFERTIASTTLRDIPSTTAHIIGSTGTETTTATLAVSTTTRTSTAQVSVSSQGLLQLKCSDSKINATSYTWSKTNSCTGALSALKGDIYEVHSATFGDIGEYTCTATNGNQTVTYIYSVDVNAKDTVNRCTFDQKTLCGWDQSNTDVFDWTYQSGNTSSELTGPVNDHTQGNDQGSYLFIESSAPRVQGDVARLVSHNLPSGRDVCISLWYFMYGDGIGTLRVLIKDSCSNRETELFSVSGDKGEQWFEAKISVSKKDVPNDYTIILEGTVGPTYHGDIAIDDLQINQHSCSGEPSIVG